MSIGMAGAGVVARRMMAANAPAVGRARPPATGSATTVSDRPRDAAFGAIPSWVCASSLVVEPLANSPPPNANLSRANYRNLLALGKFKNKEAAVLRLLV
jgi:hypothetical protein